MESHREKEILFKLMDLSKDGVLDAKDAKRDENLHRIYMYPAMMVPAIQSAIVEIIASAIGGKKWVIDPFMGSGTSLLSCMESGLNVYGQDINPMAVIIALAKTNSYNVPLYFTYLNSIEKHIENDNDESIDVNFSSIDKWFSLSAQRDLSKIRRAIIQVPEKKYRYFFWVTMSETIRLCSNDRTSTFKLHRRTQEDIDRRGSVSAIMCFKTLCKRNLEDLLAYVQKLERKRVIKDSRYEGEVHVKYGNSIEHIDATVKFDLLLSSPPYGDNHTTVTYGQHSYLALQWIDANDIPEGVDYNYLQSTQAIDRISMGGKTDGKLHTELESLSQTIPSLYAFIAGVPVEERKKYNKTLSFVLDFEQAIQTIVPVMKKDAYYVWTIGNRNVGGRVVPNDKILIDIMKKYGIKLFYQAERKILNKNQPNKNNFSSTMEKEKILIFHNENK